MKKQLTKLIALVALLSPLMASAQGSTAAEIAEAATILSQAADGLEKIRQTSGKAINGCVREWDMFCARVDQAQLLKLKEGTVDIFVMKDSLHDQIDAYISRPSEQKWREIRLHIFDALAAEGDLLKQLKQSGQFVADDAYDKLVVTLDRKTHVLRSLAELPQPKSKAELHALKNLNVAMGNYINKLMATSHEIGKYIKDHKSETVPKA